MGLLNRYEKIRMDKNAILKVESRNRSGGKKRMNRTIRVSAAGAENRILHGMDETAGYGVGSYG